MENLMKEANNQNKRLDDLPIVKIGDSTLQNILDDLPIMKICDSALEEVNNQDKRSPRFLEYVLDNLPSRSSAFLELITYVINADFIDPSFIAVGDLINTELTNNDQKRHTRLNILHLFADRHRNKFTGNISFSPISSILVQAVRRINNIGIFDNDICEEQFAEDDHYKEVLRFYSSLPEEFDNLRDYYKYDAKNVKNQRTKDTIVQLLLAASTVKNKMDLIDMCKIANINYLNCDHYTNVDLTIITFALLFNKYINDDKTIAMGVFEKADTVPMY